MFKTPYIREVVDPQVKEAFAPKRAPWGDLRKTWKAQHCARVNPTGYPEDCPYSSEACALAFLEAVTKVVDAREPGALFRKIARWEGLERADNKPPARDSDREGRESHLAGFRRTDAPRPVVPQVPGLSSEYLSGRTLRENTARRGAPTPLATLLGAYHPRPRQGPADDGEEGT